jgi:large subunit ribosomal protein L21
MAKAAIIRTGGKQYLVQENDEIVVQKLEAEKDAKIDLETLAVFDTEGASFEAGSTLKPVKAQVVEQGQGEKVRIARFKAKVRYRKVMGFRPQLTKLKIVSL